MKILLIDDEPHIIRALSMLFEKAGYEVSTAHNGVDGLAKLQAVCPDVAIVDVVMPGLSGLELLRAWHSQRPQPDEIQFLMLTASCDDEIITSTQQFDNVQLLAKPFSPTKILRLVQQLVDTASLRHEPV